MTDSRVKESDIRKWTEYDISDSPLTTETAAHPWRNTQGTPLRAHIGHSRDASTESWEFWSHLWFLHMPLKDKLSSILE